MSLQCRCLTAKGLQCSRNASSPSLFCKQHESCLNEIGKVEPSKVVQKAKQAAYERLKLEMKGDEYTSIAEKRRMARDCTDHCCGLVDGDICKYPLCRQNTCERDCDRIRRSTIAARIQKRNLDKDQQMVLASQIQTACRKDPACGPCHNVYSDI